LARPAPEQTPLKAKDRPPEKLPEKPALLPFHGEIEKDWRQLSKQGDARPFSSRLEQGASSVPYLALFQNRLHPQIFAGLGSAGEKKHAGEGQQEGRAHHSSQIDTPPYSPLGDPTWRSPNAPRRPLSDAQLHPAPEPIRERTLGGKIFGQIRGALSNRPTSRQEAAERAEQDDIAAEIVGDIVALTPGPWRFAGAAMRAALLSQPEKFYSAPGEAARDIVKNFVQGMALHGVGQIGYRAKGLLGASFVARMGFTGGGIGGIKTASRTNFYDSDGQLTASSIGHGSIEVAKGTGIGIATGLLGGTFGKYAGMSITALSTHLAVPAVMSTKISYCGAGYFAGYISGGVDSALRGKNIAAVTGDANRSGQIGAVAACTIGAFARTPGTAVREQGTDSRSAMANAEPPNHHNPPILIITGRGAMNRPESVSGGRMANGGQESGGSPPNYYVVDGTRFNPISKEQFGQLALAGAKQGPKGGAATIYFTGANFTADKIAANSNRMRQGNRQLTIVIDAHKEPVANGIIARVHEDFMFAKEQQKWITPEFNRLILNLNKAGISPKIVAHSHGSDALAQAILSPQREIRELNTVVLTHPVPGKPLTLLTAMNRLRKGGTHIYVDASPEDWAMAALGDRHFRRLTPYLFPQMEANTPGLAPGKWDRFHSAVHDPSKSIAGLTPVEFPVTDLHGHTPDWGIVGRFLRSPNPKYYAPDAAGLRHSHPMTFQQFVTLLTNQSFSLPHFTPGGWEHAQLTAVQLQ
jgi:hypothetical protein